MDCALGPHLAPGTCFSEKDRTKGSWRVLKEQVVPANCRKEAGGRSVSGKCEENRGQCIVVASD